VKKNGTTPSNPSRCTSETPALRPVVGSVQKSSYREIEFRRNSNDEYYVSLSDENDVEPDGDNATVPVHVPTSSAWSIVALDPRAPTRIHAFDRALQLPGSIVVAAASAFPHSSPADIAARLAKEWDIDDTAVYVLRRRVADVREKERQDKARELGKLIDPADM